MLSKFVVVEVSNTNNTMALVEYLVTHGFDKFAVVTDLMDHPSFKYKDGSSSPESPSTTVSTAAQHTPPRTAVSTPTSISAPVPPHNNTPRASIESIAKALSTKKKKEQDRQQAEIHRILLQQAAHLNTFGIERMTPEYDDNQHSETISEASSEDLKAETDSSDFGLGTSDEQVRASMIHLLNPAFGSAFGLLDTEAMFGTPSTPTSGTKRRSRWNLLRHVIMSHSDAKSYKCWDCDFTGIKSNVISHARQCRHRADDAHDITTDEMRAEWNLRLHECFPDYVRAKERGWQPEESPEKKPDEESPVKTVATLIASAILSQLVQSRS
ncbi:hypothetical protein GCK72_006542 [Caenorhabditis remanei]|uniref:Uncharacterized protein n=1 Tax=Caenorhabditis remanei TaxID=31234 RepID=A0A6A5HJ16_CAERE|nr:hypothetical protein GCK72_006542 [Caenorhabditis remanei]KAF1766584.1 hypothetical protein GCK72_006542 [Caenorhabditis remanei]